MAKFSRQQLKEVRAKLKDHREKENECSDSDSTGSIDEEKTTLKQIKNQISREVPKFTHEHKRQIRNRNQERVKVTWNIKLGDLVYLPDNTVGLVVKDVEESTVSMNKFNNAKSKNSILRTNYGKVYVVSSKGNSWYQPSSLKPVD